MTRFALRFNACALAAAGALLASAPNAQQAASPTPAAEKPAAAPTTAPPPSADDICRAVEQDAAENELPVEFFARVIWQESRFNARAVSSKGARGIAQFMPQTADWRGLADPFDPIAALRHSAVYLGELRKKFGNLGLAAAGYNAGPGRVSEWLAGSRTLPGETRNYVAVVTGWTADEWASPSPPQTAETTIPQGIPCARLANLILAPTPQALRIAAYVPRWGAQLTANWSESRAWATYRALQKQYAALIGDDSRAYLDRLCGKLIAAGGACVVLRNNRG
jgi:Transglycosylase SLT domain